MSRIKIHANINGSKILGSITMQSDNVTYKSAGKNEDTKTALSNLFNKDINPNSIQNYADGTHDKQSSQDRKYELWGNREENGDQFRTFFTYKGCDEAKETLPFGYVTVGVNNINVNNFETGIFFTDETLATNAGKQLASEAFCTVTTVYPNYIKAKSGFGEKQFVFYDANYKEFKEVAQGAGFIKFDNLQQVVDIFGAGTNITPRFNEHDGQIYEGNRAVDAFYAELNGDIAIVEEY